MVGCEHDGVVVSVVEYCSRSCTVEFVLVLFVMMDNQDSLILKIHVIDLNIESQNSKMTFSKK